MFGFSLFLWQIVVIFASLNFIFSFVLTKVSLEIAKKLGVLDNPNSAPERKLQKHSIPLLGATGFVFSSLFFTGLGWLFRKNIFEFLGNDYNLLSYELGKNLEPFRLAWVFVGILIIMLAGYFDDKYQFSSKVMILPTFVALFIVVVFGGLKIETISLPFGIDLPNSDYFNYLLAFFWIGICLTATKFLDGLDGLVSTVGIVSLLIISLVATLSNVMQPLIFLFGIIWASGIAGFLPWNLPEAKVYLGEAGAQVIGLIIGVLSILSGAKVATAATVIGWFIFDILFVFSLRLYKRKNPLVGDRTHWHHRLIDIGFSKFGVLFFTVFILIISAFFGLILGTQYKIYLFIGQGLFLLLLFIISSFIPKKIRS